jgi:pyrroloquinoline quinone biosynthesis protein E
MPESSEAVAIAVTARSVAPSAPSELIAELTHRCPLGCPYCSNPLALEPPENELDAATWARVFSEAAALGVVAVQLSGGEPGARRDLVDIAAHAREAGLRTSLVTSGVGIATRTMRDLWVAGLAEVQVSFQDADAVKADHIAGQRGAFQRKHALAAEAVRLGLPLTVSAVIHRANIERIGAMVELALALGAERIEFAPVRYHGWALKNRAALMPAHEQIERAADEIAKLRRRYQGCITIDSAIAGDHTRIPASCDGGWGGRSLTITPSGRALPCHAAQSIPGLTFWSVRDRSLADIWTSSPAFNAFRGSAGEPEPQAICNPPETESSSCRCQALLPEGHIQVADLPSQSSPHRDRVGLLAAVRDDQAYTHRRM